MPAATVAAPTSAKASPQQLNSIARAQILARAVPMTQKIFNQTVSVASQNILNVAPRNVGLIRGFWVKVDTTVQNTGTVAFAPTVLNCANLLSNVVFTDLDNYVRLNTTGWHLNVVSSAKTKHPFGASFANDGPVGYGTVVTPISCPGSVAAGASANVRMWYYVPLSYHAEDLRGAVYANVVNATMNLQLTLNSNCVVAAPGNPTLAVYTGAAGATGLMTSATVTVYQDYLDQLPVGQNGVVLPLLDLSSVYELKNTNLNGLSAGQDFPIPYANFREFLSTAVIFDNGGVLNTGTDINTVSLQSANFTNIQQIEPQLISLRSRNKNFMDFPRGMFFWDSRDRPISTVQYGNMQLIVNPSTVNAGAQLLIGFEDMGMKNTVVPAGSLPGG